MRRVQWQCNRIPGSYNVEELVDAYVNHLRCFLGIEGGWVDRVVSV